MPRIVDVLDETCGKYYRTELVVVLDDGRRVGVELSSEDPEPSAWEKQAAGDDPDYFCDGHYERDATRFVADRIMGLLLS